MGRFALVFLILPAACSPEPPPSPDLAVNKQMIWDVIKSYHEAADRCDPDTQLTFMTPDVSLIRRHDEIVRGSEAVGRVLRERAKSANGQEWNTVVGKEDIRVEGDLAYATYLASVGQQRGVITALFRRIKGKWLIAHFHDTWSGTSGK
jgi:ketosteroid isomerase-like protein